MGKLKADASAKMTAALEPANPKFQEAVKQMQAGLSRLPNGGINYEAPSPLNLGIIESDDSSFTSLILSTPNFKTASSEEAIPILTATTFLLCKGRLLFVYSCCRFQSTADVASLTRFVETWTRKMTVSLLVKSARQAGKTTRR